MDIPVGFYNVNLLNILSVLTQENILYLFTLLFISGILLFLSGLVSASEISFFSLNDNDIKILQNQNPRKGRLIALLLTNPQKLLATILIGNNAINISLVIISTFLVDFCIQNGANPTLMLGIQIVVITSILLLFGEIMPKILATASIQKTALYTIDLLYILNLMFQFLSNALVKLSNLFNKIWQEEKKQISLDELAQVHELIQNHEQTEEEGKLLTNILDLGNSDIRSVMQNRMEIAALDVNVSFSEVKKLIEETAYSRIPVYEDSLDKIVGILFIKDLLPHIDKNNDFEWKFLIRPPFFMTEHKKLDDALRVFQEKKNHMAIVIDEYGGTLGLVTLEDVLEEIVGEIKTEFDEEDELDYTILDQNIYLFDALILLKDMCRIANISFEDFEDHKGEYETIAGFILEIKGSFPLKNEVILFKNYKFTILSVDKKRIKQVKLEVAE
ncbi:MAG: gliding motility-associated protein GldE [Bacteroidota bacterium]|jgi:gliding motility-associated protein GldE